jgi:hypothetical protein
MIILQIIAILTTITVLLFSFGVIKIPGLENNSTTTTLGPTTIIPTTTNLAPTTTTRIPTTTTLAPTTTTLRPTTTTLAPTTTTLAPTTTTIIPTTTTIIPTTTTIKPRLQFNAGNGGNISSIFNPNGKLWGGGGAGGIIISGITSSAVSSGNTTQNCGAAGFNGTGFGAGGGGGGNWCGSGSPYGWQTGGAGTPGFVYIVEDNKLVTTVGSTPYSPPSSGSYTFIIMGGGGAGAGYTSNNSGGCSGSIYKFTLTLNTTDVVSITVGAGGTQATRTTSAGNGGNTTVSLSGPLIRSFKAVGGIAGGAVDYSTYTTITSLTNVFSTPSTNTSASLGGNSCKYSTGTAIGGTSGGTISTTLLSLMNS